ncbi:hypothetical protein BCR36DRAFT_333118 [Piromyces finnis]|uniref:RlpA-like protein double-psi beta-barrel domain-containing protein n=1 Tax=Piromyces finnis TaxID=1754191 RepID=A0A1Y1V372_9FUNG|nr:hypothetical protein BCR36DRAFT_333118 [Piromyces finnis]|eukprot:ORX45358.1 hypothetical protein BCR36DRAFT_333118 [Piromyces finnis]
MKFNTPLLTLLINFAAVYAKKSTFNAKSFEIVSSTYCKHENLERNDKLYYAAISKELFNNEKVNCDNYVVAMVADEKSKGKYKLVKALIRDECENCKVNDLKLSVKAMKDIDLSKTNVFWGIVDKKGEMINGPFQPELSKEETEKVIKFLGEKEINDVYKKFIDNAKYMAKVNKHHLKKLANIKYETVKKIATKEPKVKTTVIKSVFTTKKVITHVKEAVATAAPTSNPTTTPIASTTPVASEIVEEETSSGSNVMTGAVAVSIAAGATLLLVHRKTSKKNYIFGEPIDKYDRNTAKELYAKTKNGQKIKLQIPVNNFDDIAHIQIYSPNGKETFSEQNVDVYNVHTERAIMSSDTSSLESCSSSLPVPQKQPKPHCQLPVPTNDFMMAFSPIEQPDLAVIPKENIGSFNFTKNTSRFNDDPYLTEYKGDDSQEIYNSVPHSRNRVYANNSSESSTDILLEYVDEEDDY